MDVLVASRFEITENGGTFFLHLDLKTECDVSVESFHASNGFRGVTLGRGRLPAGPFVLRIHESEIQDGLNMIRVTLDGTEVHLHKIERP